MAGLQRGAVFKSVERAHVPFSTFDLSNENKFSCKMGRLVPFMCIDLVPGDRFRWNSNMFIRLAPMVNPVMHRMDMRASFFFVPYRILWPHWEEFRSEGNGDVLASQRADYNAPEHPWLDVATYYGWDPTNVTNFFGPGSLADYLGFPARQVSKNRLGNLTGKHIKLAGLFPFAVAAYYCIYDNYYRNQLIEQSFAECLQDKAPSLIQEKYYLKDGDNSATLSYLLDDGWTALDGLPNRPVTHQSLCEANYEHDYFTAATATPQLGDPVQIPVGTTAGFVSSRSFIDGDTQANYTDHYPYLIVQPATLSSQTRGVFDAETPGNTATGSTDQINFGKNRDNSIGAAKLQVDLSSATGITIQDFRALQALQRYRERLLAYGTRYNEWSRAVYAVVDGDSRLDRPEYIGSFSQPIQISEVLQTSSTSDEPSPLGDMAGRGVSVGQSRNFNYMAPEDGVLIGIMQITPRTGYMCGLPHSFLRMSPYDYHLPAFEHVGEQELYQQELYLTANSQLGSQKGSVFGYNPRYSEYKYRFDEVHGDMVTDAFLSWHLARDFSSQPTMSPGFFHASNVERIFAVTDSSYDKFYVQCFNKVIANRPMTLYSTPM